MSITLKQIRNATAEALINASTAMSDSHRTVIEKALKLETEENSKWLLELLLKNANTAEKNQIPVCDDTGIPHLMVEFGENASFEGTIGQVLRHLELGIADGLKQLPGRPMAVKGNEDERVIQTSGLYDDPGMVLPAPLRIRHAPGNNITITVMMLGGGPEIRSKTYRVFHKHEHNVFRTEIASWAVEMVKLLGCTPCVPCVGVGRTHYEATCMMLDAMCEGKFGNESEFESYITKTVNDSFVGPLGVGGKVSALQTFAKVGSQRASGVRIVCLRLGCCVEPRRHTVTLA